MRLLHFITRAVRNLLRGPQVERELDDELRFHLAMQERDSRRDGMAPEQAWRHARLSLGGVEGIKEQVREVRRGAFMDTLWQDIRFGLRTLRRNPGFALIAILTLALGIGANTAIFSVVYSVLLRPLPFPNSDRLVFLWEKTNQLPVMMVAYPDYLDWRTQSGVFDDLAVYNRYRNVTLTGVEQPERIPAAVVTASFFRVLGIQPAIGRAFRDEEDQRGADRTLVLSHGFWQRRFGGDPGVLGRTLTIDAQPFTVVGVAPAEMSFPAGIELFLPMGTFVGLEGVLDRNNHPGLVGLARLRDGVTVEQARAEMDRVARQLEQQYPGSNAGVGVAVNPMLEFLVGDIRPTLWMLLGAVGFVLLIACANVANLLLSRGAARQREIAICAALGATRSRLLRRLLTESVLLASLGGAIGVLLAYGAVVLVRTQSAGILPRAATVSLDWIALGFTALLALVTGIVFGLLPALQVSRAGLHESLKEGGRSTTEGRRRHWLRGALVTAEVALSLVLLAGAGLLLQSFVRLLEVNPGFNPQNLLTAGVAVPPAKYAEREKVVSFYEQVLERVRALPGVEAVAAGYPVPFAPGGLQVGIAVEGHPEHVDGNNPLVNASAVTADYFHALSIPLLRGRAFTAQDRFGVEQVVIVNEAFVQRFWPDRDPLGQRVKFGDYRSATPWMAVVGVVGDVKRNSLESPWRPELYLAHAQQEQPERGLHLVVRTAADPSGLILALRQAVLAVDSDRPIHGAMPMEQLLDASVAQRQFIMLLLAVFSGIAVTLAAVGLYGVISYSVAQRTQEIGVRVALGASRGMILRLIVGQGMRLTLIGVALGLAGAVAATRVLRTELFGIEPTDPVTLGAVAVLLAVVALAACFVPARRATRVDPLVALRYE